MHAQAARTLRAFTRLRAMGPIPTVDFAVALADEASDEAGTPMTQHLWHVWPGRNYPCTAEEERRFRADLAAVAEPGTVHRRGDVTAVLNALCCGLTAGELFTKLPGAAPARFAAAYEHLEGLRASSVAAWQAIVADPSPGTLETHGADAAKLLPIPVARLTPTASLVDPVTFRSKVQKLDREIVTCVARATAVEDLIGDASPDLRTRVGRMLYDPYTPGIWADPLFLAPRVGTLMPLRVSDLLGERDRTAA